MTPRIGSLFTGYGGLDLATEEVLGGSTAWTSDNGRAPAKIISARYPHAPNLGDITKIIWADQEPVDVITGGFPCQDLSHAGHRVGLRAGERSSLWSHMVQAIRTYQPRLVIVENVRGVRSARASVNVEPCPQCVGEASHGDLRALGAILGDLAEIGMDAVWTSIRAADVGAPHLRERLFLLAYRPGDLPAPTQPASPGGTGDPVLVPDSKRLLPTPVVNDMGANKTVEWWDDWAPRQKSSTGARSAHGASLAVEALRTLPTPDAKLGRSGVDLGRQARGSGGDDLYTAVTRAAQKISPAMTFWEKYGPALSRWETLMGRSCPEPLQDQKLSPLFVEWMMGLPEGWVTDVPGLARGEAIKLLGNGVVPQQGARAITHLLESACELEAAA